MKFTAVEAAVMRWFEANAETPRSREVIHSARPVERRQDRGGVFVILDVPGSPVSGEQRRESNPDPGPFIQSPMLPSGADTVLFFTEEGIPDTLEIFTFGDAWPEDLEVFDVITPMGKGSGV